ncbi:MAG: thymidylate kinase [Clostridia bacterium]|nr:thymidylate kinase [Clostridia bacterium]
MGYLLTIEAPDASGKSTQVNELCKHLEKDGIKTRLVRFPNYGSDACKPAELYLNGALGKNPEDTSAYAASVFFAVDRYFSYRTDWYKDLKEPGTVVILDRYTTSNAVHQLSKLDSKEEQLDFLSWLYDFEFNKLSLPVPDDTIFLDVPPEISHALMLSRAKAESAHVTDIHESSGKYLKKCYDAANLVSEIKKWKRINCVKEGKLRSVADIHDEIYSFVRSKINF